MMFSASLVLCLFVLFCWCGSLVSAGAEQTCSSENDPTCQNKQATTTAKKQLKKPCQDAKPRECAAWAAQGECLTNPSWMGRNCQLSCGKCERELSEADDDVDCTDHHPSCGDWSSLGECFVNPNYMKRSCRKSCGLCVVVSELRKEGVPEDEIRKRYRYARESWGVNQFLGGTDEEKAELKPLLMAMEEYARDSVTSDLDMPARSLCENRDDKCAFFAVKGECENNLEYMMSNCPLACFFCHDAALYTKCKQTPETRQTKLFEAGGVYNVYQRLMTTDGIQLASSDLPVKEEDDPWVVKHDTFLDEKETHFLLDLLQKLSQKWNTSETMPAGADRLNTYKKDNTAVVRRTSDSLYFNEILITQQDRVDMLTRKVADLLGIELFHLETPVEFVRYKYLQSYGMHHDVVLRDSWMMGGPRVFTTFLTLNDVDQGGAMGFPDLDWLSIPPKRGQLLVWPNVLSSDPEVRSPKMASEGLPVLDEAGEKYGVYLHFRLFDWDKAFEKKCFPFATT